MKRSPSVSELQSLLQSTARTRPSITEEARKLLGPWAKVLDEVGLPARQGDWFHAVEEVEVWGNMADLHYEVDGGSIYLVRAVQIGRGEFGSIIVDCDTGHVVYVDQAGQTQLINTSLERFLYFVGRFNQSADRGFSDASNLRADYQSIDSAPLENLDGIWCLTIEEAEAGLY